MSSLKFSDTLDSGVKYEIHQMSTFSGREELAIVIENKPAVILSIVKKRNGAIEINPVLTQKTHIAGEGQKKVEESKESEVVKPRISEG